MPRKTKASSGAPAQREASDAAAPRTAIDRYTYRVSWSDEDREFVATCAEFPGLSHPAGSQIEAIEGLRALAGDVVRDMEMSGETPPEPLAERRFSGEFVTRVPSELHRLLTIEAAEAGVSLNRLVSFKLAIPLGVAAAPRAAARTRARATVKP